ncbi:hypothetical protein GUITHDRAFT_82662 [Guillardia theta CCMP2712]|uniref:U-box domain-containing protein n=1 Tax=Guillardia theta (strain CCMP2712) TaxID=905079 RepID=L1I802_GUITC|nr:hypothetical protein GUITHDRAFT_82662 [Guillardia theta CCMP2712]EKX31990.1 hypothetical protein GUITHDRAFT_82662 [Guillardia theta CCMP2712]|eukprot:XP_005818970.1 hypothetical protein GUITHDRAFT_82662 [Guillardia theta CCMP2712]
MPSSAQQLTPAGEDRRIPAEFLCPISKTIFKEPVIASDGFTYERQEIEKRFKSMDLTSPVTNLPFPGTKLIPNKVLEALIRKY